MIALHASRHAVLFRHPHNLVIGVRSTKYLRFVRRSGQSEVVKPYPHNDSTAFVQSWTRFLLVGSPPSGVAACHTDSERSVFDALVATADLVLHQISVANTVSARELHPRDVLERATQFGIADRAATGVTAVLSDQLNTDDGSQLNTILAHAADRFATTELLLGAASLSAACSEVIGEMLAIDPHEVHLEFMARRAPVHAPRSRRCERSLRALRSRI